MSSTAHKAALFSLYSSLGAYLVVKCRLIITFFSDKTGPITVRVLSKLAIGAHALSIDQSVTSKRLAELQKKQRRSAN